MTASYTYLTTDLLTNQILGEIPVNTVSLDVSMNAAGTMNCSGNLDDPKISNDDFLARTTPGKTAFWAYRENQIVWGGIILTRTFQTPGKSLALSGQTFECYAARRYPRSVLGTKTQNLNMGQCAMINYLWEQLQSIMKGNIGVLPGVIPAVDPATQLTVNGWDLSTSYDDLINNITELSDSPDWTITWAEDGNGLPLKQLVLGYPIGNPIDQTDLIVDYPGPVLDYTYVEDASSGNNQWWATGDGSGAATLTSVAVDEVSLNSGYPLWEGVQNFTSTTFPVTKKSVLDADAEATLDAFPMPYIIHTPILAGDGWPPFGSYGLGDYIITNTTDPRFPAGATTDLRAVGWSIQPPDDNQGVEEITLVLGQSQEQNSPGVG